MHRLCADEQLLVNKSGSIPPVSTILTKVETAQSRKGGATALAALADQADPSLRPEEQEFRPGVIAATGIDGVGLDNLVGLGLLRYTREMPTTLGRIGDRGVTAAGVSFTSLGWALVRACRNPAQSDADLSPAWAEPYEEAEGS